MSQPAPKPSTLAEALTTIEAQAVQINTLTTENTRLTADNAALVGKVEAFRTEFNDRLKPIEASLNVATEGHISADDKFARQEVEIKALKATLKELGQRTERTERALGAERSAGPGSGRASGTGSGRASGLGTAPPPPPATSTLQRVHPRPQQQQTGQHQHRPSDTVTAKFVVFADADRTPDEVQGVIAHNLGYSTTSLQSVQKLMSPAAASVAATAAAAAAAAAAATAARASTSATPTSPAPNDHAAPAPPRMARVAFVITTTKHIADQAVKGNLRQLLQEQRIGMYVDDHLTKEEQQERKRREPQRLQLKAEGIKVAWRKDALVKRVDNDGQGAWVVVPPPPPAPAAAADALTPTLP